MERNNQNAEMPFLDHLEELRKRMFRIAASLFVGVSIAAYFIFNARFDPVEFLKRPLAPHLAEKGGELVYSAVGATFQVAMMASLVIGSVIVAPYVGYQLWLFFAPALHRNERRVAIPAIFGVVVLFVAGTVFAYYKIVPPTLLFLFSLESPAFKAMINWNEYLSFIAWLCLGFGLVCELPMVVLLLAALGWVSYEKLAKFRPYMFILSIIGSAAITTDIASLFYVGGIIYVLYEVSVLLARVIFRRRRIRAERRERREREEEERESGPSGPKRLESVVADPTTGASA
jgi:sec-independent protein translocase protein TatC